MSEDKKEALDLSTQGSGCALGRWLDEAIKKAGTNQTKLAKEIGLTSQKINRIISGTREMSAAEMLQISKFLEAPLPILDPGVHDEKGRLVLDREALEKARDLASKFEEKAFGESLNISDFNYLVGFFYEEISKR